MIHKQLPPLILLLIFTCPLSCQNSPSESFDVWSFFNDKIILTFDEIIGQFIVFVNAIDKYINLSWDKVMLIMDRIVDHARDEDCYYACPRGLHPIPKSGYKSRFFGCTVFGYEVPHRHLVEPQATGACCHLHNECYQSCGTNKWHCDDNLIDCLRSICPKVHDEHQRHGKFNLTFSDCYNNISQQCATFRSKF